MKCKHCNSNIESTDSFCSYCGNKNTKKSEIRYCIECGTEFREYDNFCRQCGTKKKETKGDTNSVPEEIVVTPKETIKQQEVDNGELRGQDTLVKTIPEATDIGEAQSKLSEVMVPINHFKNPILWIISISLLLVSVVFTVYIQQFNNGSYFDSEHSPDSKERSRIANSDIEDFKIHQDTTIFMQQSNINMNGYSFYHNGTFYIALADGVVAYTNDFQEKEIILDENVSYMHVDDNYLYYRGMYSDYSRMHLETREEEILLYNIYYPQHVDGMIYYQDDSDGETMYRYDIATQESTKLNSIASFQSYVDTNRNSIYYIGQEDGDLNIYTMDLDGQNNEILVRDIATTALNYDGSNLYYSKGGIVYSFDVTTQEHREITDDDPYEILIIDDSIVGWDYFGNVIRKIEGDQAGRSIITRESVYYLQVIGEYFICWIPDGNYGTVYILDIDGNCAFLIEDYNLGDEYNFV